MYLILDVDGTLVNSKKEISTKLVWSLLLMQMRRHKIILATGRPTFGVKWIAEELKLRRYESYIISFNGAVVSDLAWKETVYQQLFPKEYMPELLQFAQDNGCGIASYDYNKIVCGTNIDEYITKEQKLNRMRIKTVDDWVKYFRKIPVNKCLMTAPPEKAEVFVKQLQQQYNGKLSIYRSEPYFIEIMPLGVDKAASLKKLFEIKNINPAETVAVGDGFNDISMLKTACTSCAMANAQPEVKAVADFVTQRTNDEDGVCEVIDRYFYSTL